MAIIMGRRRLKRTDASRLRKGIRAFSSEGHEARVEGREGRVESLSSVASNPGQEDAYRARFERINKKRLARGKTALSDPWKRDDAGRFSE